MRAQKAFTAAVLGFVLTVGFGCGDDASDGGDQVVDAGNESGGSGGTAGGGMGGMSGSGGVGGASGGMGGSGGGGPDPEAVAMCVEASFDGVDASCNTCMCECNQNASQCGEDCWKLSACVYQQCQLMRPEGMSEMECTAARCGGYFAGGANAGSFTSCWAPAMCGNICGAWFITPVDPAPLGGQEDGGTDDDAGL